MRVPVALHSFQGLEVSVFWTLATLIGVECYLIVDIHSFHKAESFALFDVFLSLSAYCLPLWQIFLLHIFPLYLHSIFIAATLVQSVITSDYLKALLPLNNAAIVILSKSRSDHGTSCPEFSGNFPIDLHCA